MDDRGFFITRQAIRTQLAAMPHELYLIRLIHHLSRRPFPGERLWTATQLTSSPAMRFLRARNCQGCDVYIQPYAGNHNAGYILVDLDDATPGIIDAMRTNGDDPCVVVQTSPGRLQAWVRLCSEPLEPALATAAGKHLARLYGGDPASTDWRHLGRLAGFRNQKPERRAPNGYALWVRLVHARAGVAPRAATLLESLRPSVSPPPAPAAPFRTAPTARDGCAAEAAAIYRDCLDQWHILERYPQPDWSIVDLWVARRLLSQGMAAAQVQDILRLASPHFPRRHGNPEDYLRRTVSRALPSAARAVCG